MARLRLNRESPIRRLRSPPIGALLVLAILLGKAIVCQHAPGRAVLFDAMLLVPISLMAYHEGIVTALVAGMVAGAADVIISKGQGNFETLSGETARPLYFILKAKCIVVARALGVRFGDSVLKHVRTRVH